MTAVPAGACSSAFASRLSSTWTSRCGPARAGAAPLDLGREPHVALVGERPPRLGALAHARAVSTALGGRRAGVGAREREQALDEVGEPLDLGQRAFGVAVLEPQAQRRQRRAQLVRGVGDELVLRAHEQPELRDRLVEDARERPHLGRAVALGRARVEVAGADRGRGRSSPRSGRVTKRASRQPTSAAAASTTAAMPASSSQYRRTRASSVEVGYVMRTAPWTVPPEATGTAT